VPIITGHKRDDCRVGSGKFKFISLLKNSPIAANMGQSESLSLFF